MTSTLSDNIRRGEDELTERRIVALGDVDDIEAATEAYANVLGELMKLSEADTRRVLRGAAEILLGEVW